MREKELRLALVCYGGISLAVYMHGVTKEIWHLARASRAELDGEPPSDGVIGAYRACLAHMSSGTSGVKLRVLADIIAGASAGGINGIFLARALASGESLEPLTDLWLTKADVTVLLDPDARPWSRFSKFWAVPIAWLASRTPKNAISTTVERSARAEVRAKLSQFVRARWFAPPFGGEVFSGLLLDAFAAMASGPKGPRLIPDDQPIDLMVTVTDYSGHEQVMRLNSPAEVEETEHRLIFSFRRASGHKGAGQADGLADATALAFAARATASFPGAFPPFTVRELDRTLRQRGEAWPMRNAFLAAQLCTRTYCVTEDRVVVDGSVLANAPFKPAIAALRQRPARREVDRRFVYIDPKPGIKSISLTAQKGGGAGGSRPELPGFFGTIFKTMSDIPRSQPIRDNVEVLDHLSMRIRRMRKILDAMHDEVEERIEAALGRTFFLDKPTPARLAAWRTKAQVRAVAEAGYAYAAYGHLKLSLIVEELARVVGGMAHAQDEREQEAWRTAIWTIVRARGWDNLRGERGRKNAASIAFFRSHDVSYRVRRLRLLARRLDDVAGLGSGVDPVAGEAMRDAIYKAMGHYLDRESQDFYDAVAIDEADLADAGPLIERISARRALQSVDDVADALIADGLTGLPKEVRRALAYSYLGFPFYDAATLPLLQGEGDGEFDPIKIDRISPDDATAIRKGGAAAMLKGIQFNSFGAFFSRSFRENDYLWGRLNAAERLLSIVASAHAGQEIAPEVMAKLRHQAFTAILSEEEGRLTHVHELIAEIRREIG